MRIFITGASGFIGGHTSERLAADGHTVLAMARSERSAAKVRGFGAEPVRCALGAVEPAHLEGVDAIVHCAAFVEEWGTREQFWQANVEGTQQLLDAARAAGVTRFIHIGTEAALFDGSDLRQVDESAPYPSRQRFLYSETKAEAERRVLAAHSDRFFTLSLRPRFVWGPRDTSVRPAVEKMVREGGFSWIDGGRHATSTTHVANLVEAVALALSRGQGGQAYFVSDDEDTTLRQFLTALMATGGLSMPTRSLPGWLARSAAWCAETLWRTFRLRGQPPLTRFAAAMMSAEVTVRTGKARAELGWSPVISVAEGMAGLSA